MVRLSRCHCLNMAQDALTYTTLASSSKVNTTTYQGLGVPFRQVLVVNDFLTFIIDRVAPAVLGGEYHGVLHGARVVILVVAKK